jgi:GH15 family glucan-1,4-alpha-glucosidase
MEKTMQPQEATKEPMIELDTGGNAVDVELKQEKEIQVEEQKEDKVEQPKEVVKEVKKDEREEYSKDVQKRIDRMTYKIREAERREKEALAFAKQIKKEKDDLQVKFDKVDDGYVNEFSGRVKSELETAKVALANAVAKGDINAQVEANQNLARLAIEEERIKATEAQRKAYEESLKNTGQIGDQPVQNNVQPPKPDPKAEAWAERNEWFGKDEAMTYASFGIHKKLVEEEGFNPSSDEYYEEIDKRLRNEFPQKFNDGGEVQGGKQPAQTVASANRTTSAGRKTVRLTPSQVAIAKKLGVPLEEYAKYVKE